MRFGDVVEAMEEIGMVKVLEELGVSMEEVRSTFYSMATDDYFMYLDALDEDLLEMFESFGFEYYDYFDE